MIETLLKIQVLKTRLNFGAGTVHGTATFAIQSLLDTEVRSEEKGASCGEK
jgi:hypothetical protein